MTYLCTQFMSAMYCINKAGIQISNIFIHYCNIWPVCWTSEKSNQDESYFTIYCKTITVLIKSVEKNWPLNWLHVFKSRHHYILKSYTSHYTTELNKFVIHSNPWSQRSCLLNFTFDIFTGLGTVLTMF